MAYDMEYGEWKQKYDPIFDVDDVKLFETYGEDLELINLIPENYVWTLINEGEEEYEGFAIEFLLSGKHYVDRMNYVVTKNCWEKRNLTAEW